MQLIEIKYYKKIEAFKSAVRLHTYGTTEGSGNRDIRHHTPLRTSLVRSATPNVVSVKFNSIDLVQPRPPEPAPDGSTEPRVQLYSVHTATTRRLTSPRGQRFELTLLPSAPSTFQSRGAPVASSTSTAPPPPQSTAPLPSGLPSRTADDKSNTARAYHLEPSGTTPRVHSPRAPHGPSSPRLLLSFPQPLAKARRCCVRAPWRHGAAPRGETDGGLRRAFGGRRFFLVPSFCTACGWVVPIITDKARRALFPRVVDSRGICLGGGGGGGGGLLGSLHPPGSRRRFVQVSEPG